MHQHKLYHLITATPFKCTGDYMEFEPCEALKPYIRCFCVFRRIYEECGGMDGE